MRDRIAFCLMGPTAIGKTELACELVQEFPFEIVNVDSSLVYQELNIGAAKPEIEILEKFPHHLMNHCNLSRIYSVADFYQDVSTLLPKIWERGHIPLLVGGSMMYFHAAQQGLAVLPPSSEDMRHLILQEAEQVGWPVMHRKLQELDPQAAAQIHPNDKQRVMRGLEIYRLSGKTWSDFLQLPSKKMKLKWYNLVMLPEDRSWLHQRIAQRLDGMIQKNLLLEVEQILKLPYLNLQHPALKSVGYRQVIHFLLQQPEEQYCWQEAILFASRQLAKRQITWLRGFQEKMVFFCPDAAIKNKMIVLIRKLLDNI